MNRRSFLKGLTVLTGIPALLVGVVKGEVYSRGPIVDELIPKAKAKNKAMRQFVKDNHGMPDKIITTGPQWENVTIYGTCGYDGTYRLVKGNLEKVHDDRRRIS